MRLIIISTLFLAACGAAVQLAVPAQTDADRGSKTFSGLTIEELSKGKTAYENDCKKCHGLKDPKKYSEEKWRKVVPPMAKKAEIDAATENLILKYVITMSSAAQ